MATVTTKGCEASQEPPGEAVSPSLLDLFPADRPGMPVCLVTGFLGSGKTTLVNHILANTQGLRAAVFVNEFGSVDVDGALVRSHIDEARVVSLTNGCVCCEVNEDLAKQLSLLLQQKGDALDVVIIETSGVCDPEPVLTTLQQVEDVDKVHLDTVVCMVDASTVDDERFGGSFDAKRQLAHVDVVLLNKVDLLLEDGAVETAENRLREYCRAQGVSPHILRTVRSEIDLAALCGLAGRCRQTVDRPLEKRRRVAAEPAKHSEGQHKHSAGQHKHKHRAGQHTEFISFTYKAAKPFDVLKFEEWAENPPVGVLRAKGLLWMRGIPKYVCFHLAGRRTNPFETLPGKGPPSGSEIVFIGRADDLSSDASAVREALDRCLCE